MKIKVKRYKEIERLAITEALQKILGEEMDSNRIATAVLAIKASGLHPYSITEILSTIDRVTRVELALPPEVKGT